MCHSEFLEITLTSRSPYCQNYKMDKIFSNLVKIETKQDGLELKLQIYNFIILDKIFYLFLISSSPLSQELKTKTTVSKQNNIIQRQIQIL